MGEPLIAWLLGGGGAISIATLIWQWRKQTVDKQVTTTGGLSGLVDQLQEERDTEKASRIKFEADLRQERAKADHRERTVGALEYEIDALYAYLRATLAGVAAGTIPPWLEVPYALHAKFPPSDLPDINPPRPQEE